MQSLPKQRSHPRSSVRPDLARLAGRLVVAALSLAAMPVRAAGPSTRPTTVPATLAMTLWSAPTTAATTAATTAMAGTAERDDGTGRTWAVSVPGVLVYLPRGHDRWGHRTAIIACPGGGYTHLTRLAGADGAVDAFLPKGVVVISLKYRLEPPSANVEADARADVQRAVRLVRYHAAEWGIDPARVGILGWSAGANAGLNAATRFDAGSPGAADRTDRESCRPAFVALMSPWPHGHAPADYPVPPTAPPAFICSARDDHTAPASFAQAIAADFQAVDPRSALWLIDTGGHAAFTIGGTGEGGRWVDRFLPWLRSIGAYDW